MSKTNFMTILAVALCAFLSATLLTAPAFAQEAEATEDGAAPESAPAEAPAEPAEEEAPPVLAAPLTDTGIPIEEFALRLIPLTADELSALADEWLVIAQGATQAVADKEIEIQALDGEQTQEQLDELTTLTDRRGELFERYTSVVDSLEKKGGAADAVAGFRAYRNAVVVEETQAADWRTLLARWADWTTDRDGGIQMAINVAVVGGSLLGLLIVARIVRRFARRWLERVPNLSKLLQSFIVLVIYWLVIAFGLMVVLSALGVDITPLFALVGGASFIMAFALQDTLGNLAAGLMIMINRPFDEGDYVDIAGTSGTVDSVSIVSTTVTTPDNQVIVIPNSKVWGNVITNVTASETRRVDLVFGIGYDDSIEDAQRVLEETVAAHPMTLKDPEPVIRVNALGASSVDFVCRPWVKADDYWTVYWDLTRQVKEAFDNAGISIPFPQTDMHIKMPAEAPKHAFPPTQASETVGDTAAERYSAGDGDSDS